MSASPAPDWPKGIYDLLIASDVKQVAYVPDAGHARLIEMCRATESIRTVSLTTEEEGVAMLAGTWLGGQRGVLLMQSSGVGNCINMFGMIRECHFPLLMLVTMRGQWGEFNPWQIPMGEATATVLRTCGLVVKEVDEADRVVDTVTAAAKLAFDAHQAVAVLISQRIMGSKNFRK